MGKKRLRKTRRSDEDTPEMEMRDFIRKVKGTNKLE
jgi:hypothetical protein